MKSNNEKLNDTCIHREYNIKNDKEIYNLRIEMDNKNIYFKLKKLNESIDYIYKNKFKIESFINILELNSNKYCNYELILKIFDKLYNKNNILIDEIDVDNIHLKIKYSILYDDIEKEIKLYKEYMNINDKINIMYNQLKLLNTNNNKIKLKNNKFSNFELILKIFDKLYNKDNILIEEIDNDNDNINLKIRYSIFYDDIEKEIKLYKEYMNIDDKINIMYNQLKLKNNYNKY